MKKALLIVLATMITQLSFACTATFTSSSYASGSSLLGYMVTNTSSYGTVPTGYVRRAGMNWGDATSSTPIYSTSNYHLYSAPGTYTVRLWVSVIDSSSGTVYCTDTTSSSISVSYPPCGVIIYDTIHTGGVVNFGAYVPAGTTGMSFYWSFGDGGTATGSNPIHTYASNGTYTVTLSDTSTSGCTYTTYVSIHVTTIPLACSTVHASFTSSVSYYTASFSNTSTYAPGVTKSDSWQYGDGHSGTVPYHVYTAAGTYTVKLIEHWLDSSSAALLCSDSVTHTVTITTAPPNVISGTIRRTDSTGTYAPTICDYKVWLITYDSATHIITAIDSTLDTGAYAVPYHFNSVPSGTYLVKAAITNGYTTGSAYIPTYHYSSTSWSGAYYIYHTGGPSTGNDIYMQHGTATTGPGFIAGDVRYGAGKGTGTVGDPVKGLLMMVQDGSGNLVSSTYTDAAGHYLITGLPLGTYTVYPEELGYNTTAWTAVSLNAVKIGVSNINFKQTSTAIKPDVVGIGGVTANTQSFIVYPNPSNGVVTIQWDNSIGGTATIEVNNIAGQHVYQAEQKLDATGRAELNLSKLNAGIYFINIASGNEHYYQKLVIQH